MRAKSYQSRQPTGTQKGGGDIPLNSSNECSDKKKREDEDYFLKNKHLVEKLANVNPKHREMLKDILAEDMRISNHRNFIRIYPTKNSDIYD